MTTAKTTFKRATRENQQAFNKALDVLGLAGHEAHAGNADTAAVCVESAITILEELEPYLFPETNKVNY